MQLTFQQVKNDIYNYAIHESIKKELIEKSKVNTKMAQTYSDMPKGSNVKSDRVSDEVCRRMLLETRIKRLNAKMAYIDEAMCVLDETERKVIEYIKQEYKMTRIAIVLRCPRRKVAYIRDKAIEKIWVFANKNVEFCLKQHCK